MTESEATEQTALAPRRHARGAAPDGESSQELVQRTPEHILASLREVIMEIGDVDEDPTPRMLEYVITHPPEQWGELWEQLPSVRDSVGRQIRCSALRAAGSDYESELGVYLICEVTWLDSGEVGLLTCGSRVGMAQLLALYRAGRLPADLEIRTSKKPTRAGRRPIHFHYLDRAQVARPVN